MTSNTRKNFTSPVGRLLWGSLYTPNMKDFDGNPRINKETGQPSPRYEFGVGFPKIVAGQHFGTRVPAVPGAHGGWELGAVLWELASKLFPGGEFNNDDFSWKIADGDSTKVSSKSKSKVRPCDREGYPGHWVVTFSSTFAPTVTSADGKQTIVEKDAVKPGYFVQVAGTIDRNTGKSPGMYVNHDFVALAGYGAEIQTGPDPSTLGFGQAPLPAGASATPVGGFAPPAAAPATPASPAAPPAYTPPPAAAAPPAQVPVTPSAAFIAPPAAPAAPPPAPAAPAAGPQMLPKAGNTPYAAFIQGGWTDATLRANGYLA